jgi:RimJ/RimL family protein N-acetyltransferase
VDDDSSTRHPGVDSGGTVAAVWSAPKIRCRLGGWHEASSARLTVATARASEMIAQVASLDAEARYRQGTPNDLALPNVAAFGCDPYVASPGYEAFVGRERGTNRLLVDISLSYHDGRFQVGGNVAAGYRRQGYGREALGMVCVIAHRHLGIAELNAGCEVSNDASRRWLASCGFTPTPGPPRTTLANGRVVEACWWRHVDPAPRLRCRNDAWAGRLDWLVQPSAPS